MYEDWEWEPLGWVYVAHLLHIGSVLHSVLDKDAACGSPSRTNAFRIQNDGTILGSPESEGRGSCIGPKLERSSGLGGVARRQGPGLTSGGHHSLAHDLE